MFDRFYRRPPILDDVIRLCDIERLIETGAYRVEQWNSSASLAARFLLPTEINQPLLKSMRFQLSLRMARARPAVASASMMKSSICGAMAAATSRSSAH